MNFYYGKLSNIQIWYIINLKSLLNLRFFPYIYHVSVMNWRLNSIVISSLQLYQYDYEDIYIVAAAEKRRKLLHQGERIKEEVILRIDKEGSKV